MQLINTPKDEKSKKPEEWAEFLHKQGEVFTDFNQVREEIIKDTDKITNGDKGLEDTFPPQNQLCLAIVLSIVCLCVQECLPSPLI